MLIVAHPDHLLYHPPAHESVVEDQLFGGFYNVLHQVHLWMADIIMINPTHSIKGSTVTVSWLKFVTNTGMVHIYDPLILMVAPLAPHRVMLVGLFSNRCQASHE